MKKLIAVGVALILSVQPRPAQANPAIAAPALCATGVGCFFVGAVVISGATYYVWEHGGREVVADIRGQVVNRKNLSRNRGNTFSRPISGIEAAKRGDAHWAVSVADCYKLGRRIGKKPKQHPPAQGGGVWCIFPGEQTDLGDR